MKWIMACAAFAAMVVMLGLPGVRAAVRMGAWVFYGGYVSQLWSRDHHHGPRVAPNGMAWKVGGRDTAGERLAARREFALVIPLRSYTVAISQPRARPR